MSTLFLHLLKSATDIKSKTRVTPKVAIQLGTGLTDALNTLLDIHESYEYADIFATKQPTALTHRGRLHLGTIGSTQVCVFQGRLHLYEGHTPYSVCQNIIFAKLLGCDSFITTNAAGALNPTFVPGDVALISDHLNLTGVNPLIGLPEAHTKHFKTAHLFTDMIHAYNPDLSVQLSKSATQLGITLNSAVYAGVLGPSLETSAERRLIAQLGADVVGMSTVNEVIMGQTLQMKMAGLSVVTNMATGGREQQPDSIEQILEYAAKGGAVICRLIEKALS